MPKQESTFDIKKIKTLYIEFINIHTQHKEYCISLLFTISRVLRTQYKKKKSSKPKECAGQKKWISVNTNIFKKKLFKLSF